VQASLLLSLISQICFSPMFSAHTRFVRLSRPRPVAISQRMIGCRIATGVGSEQPSETDAAIFHT
jgi:lipopolysaccharide/colanic/teichoic acid biosynthesis glycosyltransferase